MGSAINLNYFLAMGLLAQNYFLTHILVWNMLIQLIVVGCLYLLARLAAGGCGRGCTGNWRGTPWWNTLCRT